MLSTPHEKVLAHAWGLNTLTDGLIPWAGLEASEVWGDEAIHKGWAFITPCHWAMGREHATMTDPMALALTPQDSQMLLAAMQPYFATEGITLHYVAPERWLAEGEIFRSLPTASLDRVLGRNVDPWLPPSKAMKLLQNEMQMLLYTHALNDERGTKRLSPVNSFWISGTGALYEYVQAPQKIDTPRTLAQAAFKNDWVTYVKAWGEIDAIGIARLLMQQNAGKTVRITLCGECNAQTFETATQGLLNRLAHRFSEHNTIGVLSQL